MPVCNDAAYDFLLSSASSPAARAGCGGAGAPPRVVPVAGAARHRRAPLRRGADPPARGAPVGDSGIVSPASIEIESAPLGRGDRSRIRVDGRSVGGGDRGVNVAIVDPSTGVVEERLRYSCGDLSGMNDAAVYELIPEGAR